jgi:hypothetical protein
VRNHGARIALADLFRDRRWHQFVTALAAHQHHLAARDPLAQRGIGPDAPHLAAVDEVVGVLDVRPRDAVGADQFADLGVQRLALGLFLLLAIELLVPGSLGFGLFARGGFLGRRPVALVPGLVLLGLELLALLLSLGLLDLLLVHEPGLQQLLAQ